MTGTFNNRKERYHINTSMVFSDVDGPHRFEHATLYNFNKDGVFFEADDKLKPGTEIIVEFGNYMPGPYGPEGSDKYLAEVKWCHKMEDSDCYAVGTKINRQLG